MRNPKWTSLELMDSKVEGDDEEGSQERRKENG